MSRTELLTAAIKGDYRDWRGLDEDESAAAVAESLAPLRHTLPIETRTRGHRRFSVTTYERASPPLVVEAWTPIGDAHVALVEWDGPRVTDLEATLESYGPPELALKDRRLAVDARLVEMVYPSRGINFSVGSPLRAGEDSPRSLHHVQLFVPATKEFYLTELGPGPDPYPHPHP